MSNREDWLSHGEGRASRRSDYLVALAATKLASATPLIPPRARRFPCIGSFGRCLLRMDGIADQAPADAPSATDSSGLHRKIARPRPLAAGVSGLRPFEDRAEARAAGTELPSGYPA
jgi:hypothetical protein